ncbi:hypothetical protein HF650_06725 [Kosakonia sp. SMBL-WEM22]|uniref:hypothetical protein n=1 Tax=Kosakonia sp. SMBL-WEM22 TaxID=2725560 RepID=UPI001659E718|nr:hypothetical protein [Kosakonia sp. SMBL-WEM22]QNQ19474.1 hypothetical protein HF650_06725 [Kosakonia sp. SMBL-WEM22]
MALTLIRPTTAYRIKLSRRTRLPDGANAYPAYNGISQKAIAPNPFAGWRFAYPAYNGVSH